MIDAFKQKCEDVTWITRDNAELTALFRKTFPSDAVQLKNGKCLIISQEKYDDYPNRDGSHKDVIELTKTFKSFGCHQPVIKRDIPDARGFRDVMSEFKKSLAHHPESYDYVVVCILSHGTLNKTRNDEEFVGTTGDCVSSEELLSMITDAHQCPVLKDKPKLFLIQACRGALDNDISSCKSQPSLGHSPEGFPGAEILKGEIRTSGYFKAYSTIKHYVAYRHSLKGSPFIQAFCKTMQELGHQCYSLVKIMQKTGEDLGRQGLPQCAEWTSTIVQDLYFTRQDKLAEI